MFESQSYKLPEMVFNTGPTIKARPDNLHNVGYPGIAQCMTPADIDSLSSVVRPKSKELPQGTDVKSFKITALKTSKDEIKQRNVMKDNIIPRHPSSCIMVGTSGSGKSVLMTRMLMMPQFYGRVNGKHYFDEIYLFSPTAGAMDDLCRYLIDYTPLKKENIFNEFDQKRLMDILDEQKKDIEEKGIGKSRKLLILLDDIQADGAFLRSKTILKLFIMNRHYNTSVWLCGQSFNKTPRACRLQANNIFYFPGSKSETDLIIDEFSPPRIRKRDFEELVNEALESQYSFLHINMRCMWKERYRKNLDMLLRII